LRIFSWVPWDCYRGETPILIFSPKWPDAGCPGLNASRDGLQKRFFEPMKPITRPTTRR